MAQKKVKRRHNSFWAILGFGNFNFDILGKYFGFTLVELLVVVAIIGILVSASLVILNPFAQIQKANDAKRKGDLSQIQKALETHYHDFGKYPKSDPTYKILWNGSAVAWGSPWTPYMSLVPKDPQPQRTYVYFASSDQQTYWIYAFLERPNDPQLCNTGGSACNSLGLNGIPAGSCGATCNFGVSSSNTRP